MDGYDYHERAAICEHHGGLSQEQADKVATLIMRTKTRDQAPDTWAWANRRWRAVVAQAYGQERMDELHDALKRKHGVDSFNQLTVGQLLDSAARIESSKT